MRPERGAGGVAAELTAGGGGRPSLWRTPTPYLFIGFVVVMALIAVALAVLLCSRRKEADEAGRGAEGERSHREVRDMAFLRLHPSLPPRVSICSYSNFVRSERIPCSWWLEGC